MIKSIQDITNEDISSLAGGQEPAGAFCFSLLRGTKVSKEVRFSRENLSRYGIRNPEGDSCLGDRKALWPLS